MSKRVKVRLVGPGNRVATIDLESSKGARVGDDLLWPDGTVVQEDEIRGSSQTLNSTSITQQPGVVTPTATIWSLILEIPAFIKSLAALVTGATGIVVKGAGDTAVTREIEGTTDQIDVADGDGVAGNPVISISPNYVHHWPAVKNSVEVGEDVTVEDAHQLICFESFTFDGGSLTLDGDLVVIGPDTDSDRYAGKGINYTLEIRDRVIEALAPDLTFTLPTAVGIPGRDYRVKNFTSGSLTLEGDGSELVDGELTAVLATARESITVVSDGANWSIV